jgi:transposase-like protein
MPKPYDVAFRGRAVAAYEAGEGGYVELAALFSIGYRTLERWVAQYRATDSVAPRPRGGGWRCPIALIVLHAVVRERPDGTSDELCRAYNRRVGRAQRTTATSFRRAMGRAGYVLKKNGRARVSRIDPTFGPNARRSARGSVPSTRSGWSPSMKRA